MPLPQIPVAPILNALNEIHFARGQTHGILFLLHISKGFYLFNILLLLQETQVTVHFLLIG